MNISECRSTLPDRISGEWLYLLTAFGIVICIASIVGNGIILVAYLATRRLQKPCNLLLTNLAFSDMLYGLSFPVYVSIDFDNDLYCNVIFAHFWIGFGYLVINMQLNNIAAIALERFIGIEFPYVYQIHVTEHRTFVAVCLVWTVGILRAVLAAAFYYVRRDLVLAIELPILSVLAVFNLVVYCRIYIVSTRHLKKDRTFGIAKQESKALVAVQIALFNAMFWLPVVLVRFVDSVIVDTHYWVQATFLSPFIGSCFNLVIYTYRMAEYRIAVRRLLKWKNTSSVAPIGSVSQFTY